MLNNSRRIWWGAPSATQGMGHSSAHIAQAIERRLGKNFLPTFNQRPASKAPFIAQNNNSPRQKITPVQLQRQKSVAPKRRLISNYNQAVVSNSNTPKVTPPAFEQKNAVQRSIASGVFVKNNGNYLNQSAYQKPKVPQISRIQDQRVNEGAAPRLQVGLNQNIQKVQPYKGNYSYKGGINQSAQRQPNTAKPPVENKRPQNEQRPNYGGPVRNFFGNMGRRIQARRYRRNQGPRWTPIESIPQNTGPKQVAKAVGKFIKHEGGGVQSNCTGTLISPKHVILNSHCNDHQRFLRNGVMVFDYEQGKQGGGQSSYQCNKVILQDRPLDILILECQGRPGDKYGFVELEEREVPRGAETYIVHHPGGSPKKYSEGVFGGSGKSPNSYWDPNMRVWQMVPDRTTSYSTAYIKGGSSGSLSFDAHTHKAIMLNNSSRDSSTPQKAQGHTSASIVRVIKQRLGPNFLPKFTSAGNDQLASGHDGLRR